MDSLDSNQKKILFVVPTLSVVGGIEHWLKEVTDALSDQTLFVLYAYKSESEVLLNNLDEDPVCLDESFTPNPVKKLYKLFTRARAIGQYAEQKRVNTIVASADSFIISTLLAKRFGFTKARVVAVIHQQIKTQNWLSRLLLRLLLPSANQVVAVSDGIKSEVSALVPGTKVERIYNSVNISIIQQLANEDVIKLSGDKIELLSVGRLESLKRVDHQIRVVSRLRDLFHLNIIGTGSVEVKLKEMVTEAGLGSSVSFFGIQKNIFPYLNQVEVLIVTSEFESFGLVIIEAMALGKIVIAYDCDFGPREIMAATLVAGEEFKVTPYGYLVRNGDILALAKALERLASRADIFSTEQIISRAKEFSTEKIKLQWMGVI